MAWKNPERYVEWYCETCNRWKSIEYFGHYKKAGFKQYYKHICKECERAKLKVLKNNN